MSVVFLLGAGASAGSGDCWPANPPVGSTLFTELQRTGGVAASIDHDLAEEFTTNFEEGMAAFRDQRETDTVAFVRETALYLLRFRPGSANAYRYLVRTLKQTLQRGYAPTVLATLNYDLLIEHAIWAEGLRVTYHGLPVPIGNIPVLKLHGSCNFLPDTTVLSFEGIDFDARTAAAITGNQSVRVAVDAREVERFCRTQDSMAPAMAIYAVGKKVLFCNDFVQQQQASWREELTRATQIFVVGVHVHPADSHIWEPLAASDANLFYVGPEVDLFRDWAHTSGRDRAEPLADSFQSALPLIHEQLIRRP